MTTELMTLEMNFADGSGELVVGPDHPLVSVFRRAIETGKYTGDWIFLVVRPSAEERPKLLGTFACTPGERLLFFSGRRGDVQSNHPDKSLNGKTLDHVTLELDDDNTKFEEHVAVIPGGKGSRGQGRRGDVHSGFLHPWFSLLLRNLDGYEPLPKTFRFEFPVPKSDIQRRCRAMLCRGQRTAMTFPVVMNTTSHYFQLDVWAGCGTGWSMKYADALPWPTVDGVVVNHVGEEVQRNACVHRLAEDCGVITVLTRPSGALQITGLVHPAIQPVAQTIDDGARPTQKSTRP